jgi:hypothetical protein
MPILDPEFLEKLKMDRIEPTDLPYLAIVWEHHAQASDLIARAMDQERQAAEMRAQATALAGAHDSYMQHLFKKYNLTPQDRIKQDGSIVRGVSPADPPPPGNGSLDLDPHTDA